MELIHLQLVSRCILRARRSTLAVSIGFTRLPNPAHVKQHVLWRLSKAGGRTVSACLRQVPHGTELVIFV